MHARGQGKGQVAVRDRECERGRLYGGAHTGLYRDNSAVAVAVAAVRFVVQLVSAAACARGVVRGCPAAPSLLPCGCVACYAMDLRQAVTYCFIGLVVCFVTKELWKGTV
jgi:hypothetical protein